MNKYFSLIFSALDSSARKNLMVNLLKKIPCVSVSVYPKKTHLLKIYLKEPLAADSLHKSSIINV